MTKTRELSCLHLRKLAAGAGCPLGEGRGVTNLVPSPQGPTAQRNTSIQHVPLAHSHVPCARPESPQLLRGGSWDLSPPRHQKGIRTRAGPGTRMLGGGQGRWCPLAATQPGWRRQRAGCHSAARWWMRLKEFDFQIIHKPG